MSSYFKKTFALKYEVPEKEGGHLISEMQKFSQQCTKLAIKDIPLMGWNWIQSIIYHSGWLHTVDIIADDRIIHEDKA